MNPKLSIAIHSGVFEYWPQLQNLLKSFVACNEYPNIEIILVESSGNKKIRDWFEEIDFNDFFVNFDGEKTDVKKHAGVTVEKTLKFIDYDPSVSGLYCWGRSWDHCIKSFSGDFLVMVSEDYQFSTKGDIIGDFIKIIDYFGRDRCMMNFISQQEYKYKKENNRATGPHKIKTTDLPFFTPVLRKWQPTGICSRGLYKRIDSIRAKKNITDEAGWQWNFLGSFIPPDAKQGTSATVTDLPKVLEGENNDITAAMPLDFKRVYPTVPGVVHTPNDQRDFVVKKILQSTKVNPNYLFYQTLDKFSQFERAENLGRCLRTEEFRFINDPLRILDSGRKLTQ